MDNSKKIRLIQVAKEFKVGFNTLAEFLQRKGLQSDCQPTTPVSSDVYAILEKEFGRNRQSGNERNAVRERIQQKGSVSIAQENEEEQRGGNEAKEEFRGPKILGKIDLDAKGRKEPKPETEAPKAEPVVEQPKQEAPKAESKPERVVEQPKPEPKAEKPAEAKPNSVYRPQAPQLDGPKILGTMDVSNMVPGGKHKRKRLEKEKVNVAKEGKNAGKPQQGGNNKGGQQQPQQGGQQPQSKKQKKQQKQQPKPVVRPEVSDEEV